MVETCVARLAATAAAANRQGNNGVAPAAPTAEGKGPASNPGNIPTTTNAYQGAVFNLEKTGKGGGRDFMGWRGGGGGWQ